MLWRRALGLSVYRLCLRGSGNCFLREEVVRQFRSSFVLAVSVLCATDLVVRMGTALHSTRIPASVWTTIIRISAYG